MGWLCISFGGLFVFYELRLLMQKLLRSRKIRWMIKKGINSSRKPFDTFLKIYFLHFYFVEQIFDDLLLSFRAQLSFLIGAYLICPAFVRFAHCLSDFYAFFMTWLLPLSAPSKFSCRVAYFSWTFALPCLMFVIHFHNVHYSGLHIISMRVVVKSA